MTSGVGSSNLHVHAVTARLEDWAGLGSTPRASQTGALGLPPCNRATPGTSWCHSGRNPGAEIVMRWHARNALVHLPVMMSATPPKATMSSISTHYAFISVPLHPRNDISVCIIPGCNNCDVQQ